MDGEEQTFDLQYDFGAQSTPKSPAIPNEDACVSPEQFHDHRLMMVADGVSGSGPVGKKLLEEIVAQADFLFPAFEYAEQESPDESAERERKATRDILISIVTTAATRTFEQGKDEEQSKNASTLDLCFFNDNEMHLLHVGDSRTYVLLKNGNFIQLTEDHNTSVSEEHKITPQQLPGDNNDLKDFFVNWKNKKREIFRAVEGEVAAHCREAQEAGREYFQYVHLPLQDIEAVVMMSDGAHQRMTSSEIAGVLNGKYDAQRTVQELMNLARNPRRALEAITQFGTPADVQSFNGHVDDTTVAVVKVSETQRRRRGTSYKEDPLHDIILNGMQEIVNEQNYQQELLLVDFDNPEQMIPFQEWKSLLPQYLLQRVKKPMREFKVIRRQSTEVGAVIKGVLIRDDMKTTVAIKIVNDGFTERVICDRERAQNICKDNSNPNLATFIAAYKHRTGNVNFPYYHVLITEWGGDSLYDLEEIVESDREKRITQPCLLSARQIHSVVRQIANALNGLNPKHHGRGYPIVHRDIEPRNIVIDHGGIVKHSDETYRILSLPSGDIRARLIDFNLGKKFTREERASRTAKASTWIKVMRMTEYKPPELIRIIKEDYLHWKHLRPTLGRRYQKLLDEYDQPSEEHPGKTRFEVMADGDEIFKSSEKFQQSDIYSIGVLFYSLLTGRSPFPSDPPDKQNRYRGERHDMQYVESNARITIETLRSHLREELDVDDLNLFNDIIIRCLQPDPDDRYKTPDTLIEALNRWPQACTAVRNARRAIGDLETFDRDQWSNPQGTLYTNIDAIVERLSRREGRQTP